MAQIREIHSKDRGTSSSTIALSLALRCARLPPKLPASATRFRAEGLGIKRLRIRVSGLGFLV